MESGLMVLSIYCAHMAPKWNSLLELRPRQRKDMSVEVYYDQFFNWKKKLDEVNYIGDEESYIDDFLFGLKMDLMVRVCGYKWKPHTLYGAFRRAEMEETMISWKELSRKNGTDKVFEEMSQPNSVNIAASQGAEDVSDEDGNAAPDASDPVDDKFQSNLPAESYSLQGGKSQVDVLEDSACNVIDEMVRPLQLKKEYYETDVDELLVSEVGQPYSLKMRSLEAVRHLFDKMPERFSVKQKNGIDINKELVLSTIDLLKILGHEEAVSEVNLTVISSMAEAKEVTMFNVSLWVGEIMMFMFDPGGSSWHHKGCEVSTSIAMENHEFDVELWGGKILMFIFDPGGSFLFHNSCDSFSFTDDKQHFNKSSGIKAAFVLAFSRNGKIMLTSLLGVCVSRKSRKAVKTMVVDFVGTLLGITAYECLAKALATWNLSEHNWWEFVEALIVIKMAKSLIEPIVRCLGLKASGSLIEGCNSVTGINKGQSDKVWSSNAAAKSGGAVKWYNWGHFQYYRSLDNQMNLRVTAITRKWVDVLVGSQRLLQRYDQEAVAVLRATSASYKIETEDRFFIDYVTQFIWSMFACNKSLIGTGRPSNVVAVITSHVCTHKQLQEWLGQGLHHKYCRTKMLTPLYFTKGQAGLDGEYFSLIINAEKTMVGSIGSSKSIAVVKLEICVWGPGQCVISAYILEDKDVFERVGKWIIPMDITWVKMKVTKDVQNNCITMGWCEIDRYLRLSCDNMLQTEQYDERLAELYMGTTQMVHFVWGQLKLFIEEDYYLKVFFHKMEAIIHTGFKELMQIQCKTFSLDDQAWVNKYSVDAFWLYHLKPGEFLLMCMIGLSKIPRMSGALLWLVYFAVVMTIFAKAILENFVWDPGLVWVSHFTTLRTRRLLRGRICHVPRLKIRKKAEDASVTVGYELLAVSDVI